MLGLDMTVSEPNMPPIKLSSVTLISHSGQNYLEFMVTVTF